MLSDYAQQMFDVIPEQMSRERTMKDLEHRCSEPRASKSASSSHPSLQSEVEEDEQSSSRNNTPSDGVVEHKHILTALQKSSDQQIVTENKFVRRRLRFDSPHEPLCQTTVEESLKERCMSLAKEAGNESITSDLDFVDSSKYSKWNVADGSGSSRGVISHSNFYDIAPGDNVSDHDARFCKVYTRRKGKEEKDNDRRLTQVNSNFEPKNGFVVNHLQMMVPDRKRSKRILKRQFKAKVALDQETKRLWNLLIGKKVDNAIVGSDSENDMWEEERKVYLDRANSFIESMHMIQGNRHFSQWKGSVLDSLIGAFLTQNAFDSASSFAFMSLAAKFPLESRGGDDSKANTTRSISIEKKSVIIPRSECSNSENKMLSLQGLNQEETLELSKIVKDEGFQSQESPSRLKKLKAANSRMSSSNLRKRLRVANNKTERSDRTIDSVDWEAVSCTDENNIAGTIEKRGMKNNLAKRIKDYLNRLIRENGSLDLEWLRDVAPNVAQKYLLGIHGIGLKSASCIRLLALNQVAFPVDTNIARICVRLGWVPIQQLPESVRFDKIYYPKINDIQMYLWPRLCKLDHQKLYELHYQMITFGKVFCTKRKPNCNACPMKQQCLHFASASPCGILANARPAEKRLSSSKIYIFSESHQRVVNRELLSQPEGYRSPQGVVDNDESTDKEPPPADPQYLKDLEYDIEDAFTEHPNKVSQINSLEEFESNLLSRLEDNVLLQDSEIKIAVTDLLPKPNYVCQLRTEYLAYVLPDHHPVLEVLGKRDPDDPCPYLFIIWHPVQTNQTTEAQGTCATSLGTDKQCHKKISCACCHTQEQSEVVRGTLLIPCRTATGGRFPLNGTYFQVNEVFADHVSSNNPIEIPSKWISELPRRIVYMGTSTSRILSGQSQETIRMCFWEGFICTRGFERKTKAPMPLSKNLLPPAKKSRPNPQQHRNRSRTKHGS